MHKIIINKELFEKFICKGLETSMSMQHQSNQPRYKQIEPAIMNNQQHQTQISSIQMTSNSEHLLNNMDNGKDTSKLIIELNHGCNDDQNVGTLTSSSTSSLNKTKTPMCLINELVRANQVKRNSMKLYHYEIAYHSGFYMNGATKLFCVLFKMTLKS